jgi:Lrp/AsnC family transcriptional regulator, regulator for asnA, asnC and gidA
MDKLDRTILQFLGKDGRTPYTEIAQKLSISEGTVRNRVGKLIDENVLQIVGVADPQKLGFQVSAVIGVSIQGGNIDHAGKEIAAFDEVSNVLMVSGEFDLLLQVYCRDSEHLSTFLNQDLRPVEGVSHTQTFMILKTFKATSNIQPIKISA